MTTNSTGRIPAEPNKFVAYMDTTDNYQLSDDPDNPGNPRYEKWTWSVAESAAWTDFRTRADALFLQYNDVEFVNSSIRRQMMLLIEEVNEYDHDKDTGHSLLDLVGIRGSVEDCEKFHVVRGTELADESPTRTGPIGTTKPEIAVRSNAPSEHMLTVTNPDTPESTGLPEGVMFAEVYRYISTHDNPPTSNLQFEQIGVAKRGLFLSDFSEMTFDHSKKYCAWYIARYQSKTGELGNPSNELLVMIDDMGSRGIAN